MTYRIGVDVGGQEDDVGAERDAPERLELRLGGKTGQDEVAAVRHERLGRDRVALRARGLLDLPAAHVQRVHTLGA